MGGEVFQFLARGMEFGNIVHEQDVMPGRVGFRLHPVNIHPQGNQATVGPANLHLAMPSSHGVHLEPGFFFQQGPVSCAQGRNILAQNVAQGHPADTFHRRIGRDDAPGGIQDDDAFPGRGHRLAHQPPPGFFTARIGDVPHHREQDAFALFPVVHGHHARFVEPQCPFPIGDLVFDLLQLATLQGVRQQFPEPPDQLPMEDILHLLANDLLRRHVE